MEQINFRDVNARMDELFSEGITEEMNKRIIFEVHPITTPIAEMEDGRSTIINYCTPEVMHEIRKLFIENRFPSDEYTIAEELYGDITMFILATSIPNEEKQIVAEHLTGEIKEKIFDEFYERAKRTNKCFSEVPDNGFSIDEKGDIIDDHYTYNPRINGIPLKDSDNEKKLIGSNRLYEIIKSGNLPSDTFEIIALQSFLESDDFFNMPWCADKIQSLKEQLQEEKVQEDIDAYLKRTDSEKLSEIKKCNLTKHDVGMSQQLRESLLSGIPEEFNQMEKAMYLYIRLCQTFSYDDVYFLNNNTPTKGAVSNIAEYDENNNKVVCYEFAYVYSELLRSIGIEHIKERDTYNGEFNNSHANIEFLVGEMPIFADSTTTVDKRRLIKCKDIWKT